jgi:hypothetical protein
MNDREIVVGDSLAEGILVRQSLAPVGREDVIELPDPDLEPNLGGEYSIEDREKGREEDDGPGMDKRKGK